MKIKGRKLFLCLLFLQFLNVIAQKENSYWYFGTKAGVRFTNDTFETLTDGLINSLEGVATISDTGGKLLFYTDGITVWNRNHGILCTGLKGSNSSSQSAIILRKPGSFNIYYLITVNGISGNPSLGAFYTIINTDLNGGDGGLTTTFNSPLQSFTDEKITAVRHANGSDIWILITDRYSKSINAYLLSETGLNTTPVVSSTGWNTGGTIGYLRASGNGKSVAMCMYYGKTVGIMLGSFNNKTGAITSIYNLKTANPYGAEFSPSGRYLYITGDSLWQFDIQSGNQATVQASGVMLFPNDKMYTGACQIAIDNRIYFTEMGKSSLGCIFYPDKPGTECIAKRNIVDLKTGIGKLGLQNIMVTLPNYNSIKYTYKVKNCELDVVFRLAKYEVVDSVKWLLTDSNASPIQIYGEADTLSHHFIKGGKYLISAFIFNEKGVRDTLKEWVVLPDARPVIALNCLSDTTFKCQGSAVDLQCVSVKSQYLWSNGKTTSQITVSDPGIYRLMITDSNGCKQYDSTLVFVFDPITRLAKDTSICVGDSILISDISGIRKKLYLWNNGVNKDSIMGYPDKTYILQTRDMNDCLSSDTISVAKAEMPGFDGVNDTSLCTNEILMVGKNVVGVTYSVNNIPCTVPFRIDSSGTYVFSASNGKCTFTDSLEVLFHTFPEIELGNDDSLCLNGLFSLDAGVAMKYRWNTGESSRSIPIIRSGKYFVTASNGNCNSSDTIQLFYKDIALFIPTAFTPNSDETNDFYALNKDLLFTSFNIYNLWGELVFSSKDAHPIWDGTYKGRMCPSGAYLLMITYRDCNYRELNRRETIYLMY